MVGSCWLLPGPRWVDPSVLGFGAWASSSPPAPSAPQDSGLKVPQGPKQKSPCLQHLKTRTWYSHPCRRAVRSSLDLDSWICSSFGFFFSLRTQNKRYCCHSAQASGIVHISICVAGTPWRCTGHSPRGPSPQPWEREAKP